MSPSTVFAHGKREFASEIKFLVDPSVGHQIRTWAREHLAPDPNAGGSAGDTYHVASLYFDTPEFAIFHRRGWLRHSKFRIRRYGGNFIFLERKLKIAGRVAKRRTPLTTIEFEKFEQTPAPARWFADKTAARRLRPVCQIDYRRTARVSMTESGPIRLTLDEALHARPVAGPIFADFGSGVPLTDHLVLELKFRRSVPVVFRELVGQFTLSPQSFSKYRTAIQALGIVAPFAVPSSTFDGAEKGVACPSS